MSKTKKDIKIRRTWDLHPATRVKPSDKIYDRNELKRKAQQVLDEEDILDDEEIWE